MPKVLLVDDDPALLQALPDAIAFRLKHVAVDVAGSAAAALEHLRTRHYDVIVTDLLMSGMDGVSLMTAIKEIHSTTPVIMITGVPEISGKKVLENAYAVIAKPFDIGSFIVTLQLALEGGAPSHAPQ